MSRRDKRNSVRSEVYDCAINAAKLAKDGQIDFEYNQIFQSTKGTGPYMARAEKVEIDPKMFRRFLRLETAPKSQILKFVFRYGPLAATGFAAAQPTDCSVARILANWQCDFPGGSRRAKYVGGRKRRLARNL